MYQKLKYLNNTHLVRHGLTIDEYKLLYPNTITISENYKEKLQETYNSGLKLHEKSFTSKAQTELSEFIESLGVKVQNNNKKLLKGVEVDILMDDLKVGIEYNGLYYHTENMGKTRQFHFTKTKLMNNIGYGLIHIFEDEWIKNKELRYL